MVKMLASVNSLDEALAALEAEVDIIDLKQPERGALGALDAGVVKEIVSVIDQRRPLSATIGDLPLQPEPVAEAVMTMAGAGVDFVKIGFFPGGDPVATIERLTALTGQGLALIAVLFADRRPDLNCLALLSAAGFAGVMLDTADKSQGSLTQVMTVAELRQFVRQAKNHGLLCGLAGSLRQQDVAGLLMLQPDYLGFRGALCARQQRTAQLDPAAIDRIKQALFDGQ